VKVTFGFGVLAAAVALGWLGRWRVIEPEALAALCAAAGAAPSPACALRGLLVQVTFSGSLGISAVGAAALAWLPLGRLSTALALAALVPGGIGLFLFDAGWAASGAVAALLRLASGPGAPQRDEARPGDEHGERGPA
jgi:hypothetical protein